MYPFTQIPNYVYHYHVEVAVIPVKPLTNLSPYPILCTGLELFLLFVLLFLLGKLLQQSLFQLLLPV